jgi:hypothetical protein
VRSHGGFIFGAYHQGSGLFFESRTPSIFGPLMCGLFFCLPSGGFGCLSGYLTVLGFFGVLIGLAVCLRLWPFFAFLLVWLFACGFGLSLRSYWFICVAPMRGSTHFLCGRKESEQRKRLTPPARRCLPRTVSLVVRDKTVPRTTRVSDQAIIRSRVALRAPPSGMHPSENSVGILTFDPIALPPPTHNPLPCPSQSSLANRAATHAVRSGVDECCVT